MEDELSEIVVSFIDIRDFPDGLFGKRHRLRLDVALVEGAVLTERDAETAGGPFASGPGCWWPWDLCRVGRVWQRSIAAPIA